MSVSKKNKSNSRERSTKRDWREGLTPQQIARLESDEPLFPEKLAKANEMLQHIKFMDDDETTSNPQP